MKRASTPRPELSDVDYAKARARLDVSGLAPDEIASNLEVLEQSSQPEDVYFCRTFRAAMNGGLQ